MTFAGGEAAIVAHEKHCGVILKPVLFQAIEHLANGEIHRLHHAAVHGVLLHKPHAPVVLFSPLSLKATFLFACEIFVAQIGTRNQRRVHGVKRQVGQEGLVLVGSHELHRFAGEAIGQMLTIWAILEARIAVGRKIFFPAVRAAAVMAALVDVKALILRPEALVAEVPFAGEEGGVTIFLERLSESEFLQLQLACVGCGQQACVASPCPAGGSADVIGHTCAGGITTSHNARARGTAHGARGIGIGKLHPRGRQSVAVRCVVKRTAKGLEIRPAKVIDQKKNKVERLGFLFGEAETRCQCGRQKQDTQCFHGSANSACARFDRQVSTRLSRK